MKSQLSLIWFLLWFLLVAVCKAEEIHMKKEGGVYTVPVTLNGALKLNFIVDSGSAKMSIPAEVVLTLIHAGGVIDSDFLPGETYVLADGSQVRSNRFRLKSVQIGSQVLQNVEAIVTSPGAPLLLGQNCLSRLGRWSLDSGSGVFFFTTKPHTNRGSQAGAEPQNAKEYLLRGFTRLRGDISDKKVTRDVQGAIKDFTRAIQLNPHYADAYEFRGDARFEEKEYRAAISDYTRAIQILEKTKYGMDPSSIIKRRGDVRLQLKDYRGAISDYTRAIPSPMSAAEEFEYLKNSSPNFQEVYLNRACARRKLGDNKGADDDLARDKQLREAVKQLDDYQMRLNK